MESTGSSLWKVRGMLYMAASALLYATASFFVVEHLLPTPEPYLEHSLGSKLPRVG